MMMVEDPSFAMVDEDHNADNEMEEEEAREDDEDNNDEVDI